MSQIVMPKLGLTMTEGILAEWRVKPGERVRAGDVVFVVETDKIANEIEAPSDGEVLELLVESGTTVPVGTPLMRWTGKPLSGEGPAANGHGAEEPAQAAEEPARIAAEPQAARPATDAKRIVATPLARRIAREFGIDLASVRGSGPHGRIKAADVEAARARQPALTEAPAARAPRAEPVPLSAKHQVMVRRVVAAKRDVPHFYLTRRAEVSALLALRAQVNSAGGPKATVTHFILKAVGRALLAAPDANRVWTERGLLSLGETDVGMVVDTPEGLFIPILRDVGRKPLDQLCAEATELAERARSGRLVRDELEGGAVSVSNLGMTGVEGVTPIINVPQSAILGVGAVSEIFRPDAAGAPVLRREILLTLACDHRVFNGVSGARFLDAVVGGLENPYALFLTQK